MSILDKLNYENGRIFEAKVSEDKKQIEFLEACDLHFSVNLTRDELAQLIDEFIILHDGMERTES